MKFSLTRNMSRLKKKLLLYFILIAIVSISVSAEIIFELSSPRFKDSIEENFFNELGKSMPMGDVEKIRQSMNTNTVFDPLYDLRNRMILLLLVVSVSIFGAFFLFTKDIVSPMDGMVDATKKIAGGDLTIIVPKMSEDEIGQMAELINDMNVNQQDMIMQIKQEVERHNKKLNDASKKINKIMNEDITRNILTKKRMKLSDFKRVIKLGREINQFIDTMTSDLTALMAYVNMYKTYKSKANTEISQDEINNAIDSYQSKPENGGGK